MTRPRIRRMTPRTSLREALSDPDLLGDVLSGPSWLPWRTLLIAGMGEALTDDERLIFKELTGREREPGRCIEEFVGVVGRRGGKSRAIATLATYIAGLCSHPNLVAGERGIVLVIAADIDQATIVFDYIDAAFRQSPILRQLIDGRTQRELRLTNGINVEVRAADFRRLRGPTYIAVIGDEVAFWMTSETSSNPDVEILNAARPGLATTHGPLFLISSPYARRGVLWETFRRHYGPRGDPRVLVAKAPSRTMNATLPQSVVDRARERDPQSAAAEYLAEFRTDLETFVVHEAVAACISRGVFERPPKPNVIYHAFADPSGGSQDSFALAIGHLDPIKQTVVLDCLRETRPPFSPESVCEEYASILRTYRITTVKGDRYAGQWPVEQFRKFAVAYEQTAKPKSDLYLDLLPLLNSRRLELLDHPKLAQQLTSLERRSMRGGRDSIDHPPGAHDDIANALAGLCAINNSPAAAFDISGFMDDFVDLDDPQRGENPIDANRAWRNANFWAAILSGALDR